MTRQDELLAEYVAKSKSASFRRLNGGVVLPSELPAEAQTLKRIRQDNKPLMNKLELAYADFLKFHKLDAIPQGLRLKLGNGAWYKPDFFVPSQTMFIEVKGPHSFRGGFEYLKIAASAHKWASFRLVWRVKGQWHAQDVLP